MKLLIVGATGSIGRQLVEQALALDHVDTVTALVRNPNKLDISHAKLTVVRGDVLDLTTVKTAVAGQDAVLCALGAGREGTIRSRGTDNVVQAMQATDVKRLVCLSSLGVGDSRATLNFFWKYVMFGLLLRAAYADHGRQEALIRQSSLDWTIVRPGAFTDGEHSGRYRHGFGADETGLQLKVSRADVADFMLKQLTDGTYIRRAPGVSY